MSYTPTNWSAGDTITSTKMNKIEQGIKEGSTIVGPAGSDGKSAYQVWIDAGNTGTEADFIASLKGADGDTGPKGEKGDKGDTGAQGNVGPAGEDGLKVKSAELTTDTTGKLTGGTLTMSDNSTVSVTIKSDTN
jgi:hypothetical protein